LNLSISFGLGFFADPGSSASLITSVEFDQVVAQVIPSATDVFVFVGGDLAVGAAGFCFGIVFYLPRNRILSSESLAQFTPVQAHVFLPR
jgi:hypothetical protein